MIEMHCNAVAEATLIYAFDIRYPTERTEKCFETKIGCRKTDYESYNEKDLEYLREIR